MGARDQETKRPRDRKTKKCFILLMNLNRKIFPADKIAIRIDMYYLCIDVLNRRFFTYDKHK